mmetsp:Transcript_58340/g.126843  ORF Transcript_58340/g.126843 Transcript_58340/m.126843 type:complete len:288 (+) Transcript_58340:3-866(+)
MASLGTGGLLGLLLLGVFSFTSAREVCMTCYADSGPCHIPPGYNINCIYVSIIAGPNKLCFLKANDVYGSFDVKAFAATNQLTVYGMLNANAATRTSVAVDLQTCHDQIVNDTSSTWPPLGNALNIDWEPCTGTPPWPTMPFRLDMGGSVQCTSNLPAWGEEMMMVYDGAQQQFLSGRRMFNCSRRYMFATQVSKVLGVQTGSTGGMTPAMFISQCGDDADYDLYVTGAQYLNPNLTAACGADVNMSCVPSKGRNTPDTTSPATRWSSPRLLVAATTLLIVALHHLA